MQLRPDIQIQTIIKALQQVVIPAIDPSNKLAMEQIQLSIGQLALMAQRMPLQFRFDRDELQRLIDFSSELAEQVGGAESESLKSALTAGREVCDRARAEPAELVQAVHRLKAVSGAAVQSAFASGSADTRDAVQKLVLEMSKAQLLRERSWVKMQGWEPNPDALPDVETLLPAGPG